MANRTENTQLEYYSQLIYNICIFDWLFFIKIWRGDTWQIQLQYFLQWQQNDWLKTDSSDIERFCN